MKNYIQNIFKRKVSIFISLAFFGMLNFLYINGTGTGSENPIPERASGIPQSATYLGAGTNSHAWLSSDGKTVYKQVIGGEILADQLLKMHNLVSSIYGSEVVPPLAKVSSSVLSQAYVDGFSLRDIAKNNVDLMDRVRDKIQALRKDSAVRIGSVLAGTDLNFPQDLKPGDPVPVQTPLQIEGAVNNARIVIDENAANFRLSADGKRLIWFDPIAIFTSDAQTQLEYDHNFVKQAEIKYSIFNSSAAKPTPDVSNVAKQARDFITNFNVDLAEQVEIFWDDQNRPKTNKPVQPTIATVGAEAVEVKSAQNVSLKMPKTVQAREAFRLHLLKKWPDFPKASNGTLLTAANVDNFIKSTGSDSLISKAYNELKTSFASEISKVGIKSLGDGFVQFDRSNALGNFLEGNFIALRETLHVSGVDVNKVQFFVDPFFDLVPTNDGSKNIVVGKDGSYGLRLGYNDLMSADIVKPNEGWAEISKSMFSQGMKIGMATNGQTDLLSGYGSGKHLPNSANVYSADTIRGEKIFEGLYELLTMRQALDRGEVWAKSDNYSKKIFELAKQVKISASQYQFLMNKLLSGGSSAGLTYRPAGSGIKGVELVSSMSSELSFHLADVNSNASFSSDSLDKKATDILRQINFELNQYTQIVDELVGEFKKSGVLTANDFYRYDRSYRGQYALPGLQQPEYYKERTARVQMLLNGVSGKASLSPLQAGLLVGRQMQSGLELDVKRAPQIVDKMPKTQLALDSFLLAVKANGGMNSTIWAGSATYALSKNPELKGLYDSFVDSFKSEAKNIGATVEIKGEDLVIKFDGSNGFGSFVKDRTSTVLGMLVNGSTAEDPGIRVSPLKDLALGGQAGAWFDAEGKSAYLSMKTLMTANMNTPNISWLHVDHELGIHGATELMKKIGAPDIFAGTLNSYEKMPKESFKYSEWGMQFDEIQAHKSNLNDLIGALKSGESWAQVPESVAWIETYSTRTAMMSDLFLRNLQMLAAANPADLVITQDRNGLAGERYEGIKVALKDGSFQYSLAEISHAEYAKMSKTQAESLIKQTLGDRAQEVLGVTTAYKRQIYDGLNNLTQGGVLPSEARDSIFQQIADHQKLMGTPGLTTDVSKNSYNKVLQMQPAVPIEYLKGVQAGIGDEIKGRLQVSELSRLDVLETRVSSKASSNVLQLASDRAMQLAYSSAWAENSNVKVLSAAPTDYIEHPGTVKSLHIDQGRMATLNKFNTAGLVVAGIGGIGNLADQLAKEPDVNKRNYMLNQAATNLNQGVLHVAEVTGGIWIVGRGLAMAGATVLGMPAETAVGLTVGVYFTGVTVKQLMDPKTREGVVNSVKNYKELPGTAAQLLVTETKKGIPFFRAVTGLITFSRDTVKEVKRGDPVGGATIKAGLKRDSAFGMPADKIAAIKKAGGKESEIISIIAQSVKSGQNKQIVQFSKKDIKDSAVTSKYSLKPKAERINIYTNDDGSKSYVHAKNGKQFSLTLDDTQGLFLKACPECSPIDTEMLSVLGGAAAAKAVNNQFERNTFQVRSSQGAYNFGDLASARVGTFVQSAGDLESIFFAPEDSKKGSTFSSGLYLDWLDKGTGAIIEYNTKMNAYNQIKYPIPSTEANYQQAAIRSLGNFLDSFISGTTVSKVNAPFYTLGIPTKSATSNDVYTTIDTPSGFSVSRVVASATYTTSDGNQQLSSTQVSTPNLNLDEVYKAYFSENKPYTVTNSSSVTVSNSGGGSAVNSSGGSSQIIGLHMGGSGGCIGCLSGSGGSSAYTYYHGMQSLSDDDLGMDLGTNRIDDASWRNWVLPSGSMMPF